MAELRDELMPFLEAHPYSSLSTIKTPVETPVILSPWGDDSLTLHIDPSSAAVLDTLNAVVLPERLSAIYHRETKRLEFIYTAFEIKPQLAGRKFRFEHEGSTFECGFERCSDALLTLAEIIRPTNKPTITDYRNMIPIGIYVAKQKNNALYEDIPTTHPTSFWVHPVAWDEAYVVSLAQHLNFYMAYYDTKSPIVLFHTTKSEGISVQPQEQFRHGFFPANIKARSIDEELLHFWHASRQGDPARRYIYNYQILEYISHHILEAEIRSRMRKALSSPHVLDDLDGLVDSMLDASMSSKMYDTQKVEHLLRKAVDPKIVWAEVERNIDLFSVSTIFDNGFEIRPLTKAGWSDSDFAMGWPAQFAKTLREIRNGLSHAKENRMEKGIPPTKENLRKLQAWTTLVSVAATEAMLYRAEALR